ncbi:hypothetical protein AB0I08_18450, partial [Streptomyces lavendulae]
AVSPRDKNSARVMLVRAGLNPAGADLVRPAPLPGARRSEPGIPLVHEGEGSRVLPSVCAGSQAELPTFGSSDGALSHFV